MKKRRFNIFRRISILVFSLITGLCILFIAITYLSLTSYHEASMQLLNKDVAAHIAKFTSPFENDSINTKKADSVFYDAMVLSPSAEVYFLDTTGKIIAYHSPEAEIKLRKLPLKGIKELIAAKGEKYIKGTDPKDPDNDKAFSAAEVTGKKGNLGYIYVILASNKNVTNMLHDTYIGSFVVKVFTVIIVFSIIIAFIYFKRIDSSFSEIMAIMERFQNGDLEARFEIKRKNELAEITQSFNNLADLLVLNINKLKQSEKERKEFIANISHDLRTPLAIARGYIETLTIRKNTGLTLAEQETYVQIAIDKIKQVDEMVNQLFELSRIESVDFKAAKEPFVLSEILQETVKVFQLEATQKNVDLKCTRCQYHVWINADVSMMERVVQNLVTNAVNNTPGNGAVRISVTVEIDQLIVEIHNTGIALQDDLLSWINDSKDGRFPNADWSSRSGVGLLIVKRILELHGSFLKAYSNEEGNTFTFSMPVYNQ